MDSLASNTAFRPPVLDGSNYALWKVKMRMFIKSIEERAWQRVLDGWCPPRIVYNDGDSIVKPENTWSSDEVQTSNFNSKALNAIFTSVDVNMFSLITNCISAKEACDILQKHCEGSESFRRTKLRMLTSKFESLKMEENETIVDYDRRLRDIANEAFSLGDPMSNERLVSKKRNKGKAIALQTSDDSMNSLIQEANESDLGEESISLITKKFGDYLKRLRDKKKTISSQKPYVVSFERNKSAVPTQGNTLPRNEVMGQSHAKRLDSVQCHECSRFGHYANECPNRLRKNKNMAATLSEEDADEDCDTKEGDDRTSFSTIHQEGYKLQVNPYGVATGVATPRRHITPRPLCLNAKSLENSDLDIIPQFDQEELTVESVQMMYEELYVDCLKRNETNSKLSKENTDLKRKLSRLEVLLSKKDLELCKVKDDLEKTSKILAKFNTSSSKHDSMLTMGKERKIGLGYVESTYEHGIWYFDSGFSHHMTGSKEHLTDYTEVKCRRVTYGGGAKGRIVGKGTLNVDGLLELHNVRHVEGLNSNLISISQFCDDDLHVRFNEDKCEVFNNANICVMSGARSIDNYYQLGETSECRSAKVSNLDLWHQKLGHVSFKTLKNLCKYNSVRGMPSLNSGTPYVCGSCQKGKQTRVAHPVLQHCGTTRCLELLLMDLMGPIEVESLSGKTKEDDTEGLLETSEPLISTGVETGVATSEATPSTTPSLDHTESMENEEVDDDVLINGGKDIPSKIHKNHPSSQIIGKSLMFRVIN
ncbi:uncharacterized protein [Primulina huaijiensis]|uniref:uncharacterized protein n=1 Tax=Primulina huaijiensis TaxID=1492673 RepID=UPI003CC718A1